MCMIRLRHENKTAKCKFFVVLGDGTMLLGMPDVKILDIAKIMCEMKRDPYKKLDVQLQNNAGIIMLAAKQNKAP